jgi:antitoxin component YwqK of YwqJK toxin-antitoxin module
MKLKALIVVLSLAIPLYSFSQLPNEINKTDKQGKKQGQWIKKYPNGALMYEGTFKDNHPVGEFKRYYETSVIKSRLIYSIDGTEANAVIYHPNGFVSSKGKYKNQKKEGLWKFYSFNMKGYKVCEESYSDNLRNGPSLKFFPDSTIAEKVFFKNDLKQGEWTQYYPNGKICLKSGFLNDKVDGKYQVWFENGKLELSGQYKEDVRDGIWMIYTKEGVMKYKLEYRDGLQLDSRFDVDVSEYLDSLERNKGTIADPEKTGVIK